MDDANLSHTAAPSINVRKNSIWGGQEFPTVMVDKYEPETPIRLIPRGTRAAYKNEGSSIFPSVT